MVELHQNFICQNFGFSPGGTINHVGKIVKEAIVNDLSDREMKPYSYQYKEKGISTGGALGAAVFAVLSLPILGLLLAIVAAVFGFVIGAFIGGMLGAIRDKREDRKRGLR